MTSPPFQIKTRKLVVSAPTPESIGCLAAPTPECKLRGALWNASHSRIENSRVCFDEVHHISKRSLTFLLTREGYLELMWPSG